jgi:hypothetical protein
MDGARWRARRARIRDDRGRHHAHSAESCVDQRSHQVVDDPFERADTAIGDHDDATCADNHCGAVEHVRPLELDSARRSAHW